MEITLRRIAPSDIEDIARLANDEGVACMTASLPHPYTTGHAKKWLDDLQNRPNEHVFAICGEAFMGVVGLTYDPHHNRAELGYWLGRPYWGRGVATAAARMAVDYAFNTLYARRVYAYCFAVNAASKRVIEKSGLKLEGCLKQHFVRMGEVHDLFCFGLLKEDYPGKES